MKPNINLITILTDNIQAMVKFYRDVLGFNATSESDDYVEFANEGVRFAICTRTIMYEITQHEDYMRKAKGQSFELAFPVNSSDELDVVYNELISKGATPVRPPTDMPWSHRTAFIADPDGNIHELFAPKPEK
jgi:catechol 2,3-dioxygenase-like lactoylglutathione lyase family enzyme